MEYISQISESIKEAELVVVGLGEEWNVSEETKKSDNYKRILADVKAKPEYQWIMPYVYEKLTDDSLQAAYQNLFSMLEGKNYFIVATTMNSAFMCYAKADRVVMPCGSARKMCDEDLTESHQNEEFIKSLNAYIKGDISLEEISFVQDEKGEVVPFNNVLASNYKQEGYLPAWNIYMRWLQGTMNRKVCLLELGAGLEYPSVIRFPFEKMVYFNQKATCYRVHSFLYQLAEEMAERSISVPMYAVSLFAQK